MKKSSYLEWTAKGGNLAGVDEKTRSKPTKGNKQPDTKQKKGKAKVSEGDPGKGKPLKPRKLRYKGERFDCVSHGRLTE